MLVTLPGITMLVRLEQPENAHSPMLVTPLRITTLERPEQAENALFSIAVTRGGITTLERPEHLKNAHSPMLVPLLGSTMLVRPAQSENALNLLVASVVPQDLLPGNLSGISPPREISAGLSSELLLNRPDILAAEYQLKAAYANIGAARAAFFPRVILTGAAGTASVELSGLFKPGSFAWSFAPQIIMPIFDARTWFAYRVTKVDREIAVAQYEKSIQAAFREVADALAVKGTVDRQIDAQQSLVDALSVAYRLSLSRYDKGIDSYLSVLDAQRSLYGAQKGLIALQFARFNNAVTLYKALGGGYK